MLGVFCAGAGGVDGAVGGAVGGLDDDACTVDGETAGMVLDSADAVGVKGLGVTESALSVANGAAFPAASGTSVGWAASSDASGVAEGGCWFLLATACAPGALEVGDGGGVVLVAVAAKSIAWPAPVDEGAAPSMTDACGRVIGLGRRSGRRAAGFNAFMALASAAPERGGGRGAGRAVLVAAPWGALADVPDPPEPDPLAAAPAVEERLFFFRGAAGSDSELVLSSSLGWPCTRFLGLRRTERFRALPPRLIQSG